MKNICHMTNVHPRYDIRIFWKECISLANEGYSVTLLCADNLPDEIKEGVKIVSVKSHTTNRLVRILNAKNIMYEDAVRVNADIYHFHDPELLSLGLKLKKLGKKVIYDSHEDVPRQILSKEWIPKFARKIISWLFEKFENFAAKKFDVVITATEFIANRFNNLQCKTEVVCNYPLLEEFTEPALWSQKKQVCCYIGGINENRGIMNILQMIGQVSIRLNLCGNFETDELENRVMSDKNSDLIDFHGYLDRKGIKKILDESKIGLVTLLPTGNHINSLPIKMFEYMAAGIPVIASDFPLWKSIIEKNECGICVNPEDSMSISDAINILLKDDNKAEEMGRKGRIATEALFNWECQTSKMLSIYSELAHNK